MATESNITIPKHRKQYRWQNPYEWFEHYVASLDANQLRLDLLAFAARAGHDEIQDVYESYMDADGYFDEDGEDLV